VHLPYRRRAPHTEQAEEKAAEEEYQAEGVEGTVHEPPCWL